MALADVRRSIDLFKKFDIPILGLIENMSCFFCGHIEKPIAIFGQGGGQKLSEEFGLPLLRKIPLDLELGKGGDAGVPLMVSTSESETGRIFKSIAEQIIEVTREQI